MIARWRVQIEEYRKKFDEWWSTLAPREKLAATVGAFAVIIFIFYLIWSSYVNHVNALREKIVAQEKTLQWMMNAEKELKKTQGQQSAGTNKISSPVGLLSFMQQALDQAGLSLQMTQLKQASNESIEMHFQKVDFDLLMQTLIDSLKGQVVIVSQATIVATDAPGIVNADIVLSLP